MSLLSEAYADINRIPKLLYGSSITGGNGLSQRGPNSYDCIGWVRHLLLDNLPQYWPTSWGGADSWTVPNFYEAWIGHKLPTHSLPAKAGDLLIFFGQVSGAFHIGVADGQGNCLSAYNTKYNICSIPINTINASETLVLPLNQGDDMGQPLGTPTGILRTANDTHIRGSLPGGMFTQILPLNTDMVVYGDAVATTVAGETSSPVWRVSTSQGEIWVLKRNANYTPIGVMTTSTYAVSKDGRTIFTF